MFFSYLFYDFYFLLYAESSNYINSMCILYKYNDFPITLITNDTYICLQHESWFITIKGFYLVHAFLKSLTLSKYIHHTWSMYNFHNFRPSIQPTYLHLPHWYFQSLFAQNHSYFKIIFYEHFVVCCFNMRSQRWLNTFWSPVVMIVSCSKRQKCCLLHYILQCNCNRKQWNI